MASGQASTPAKTWSLSRIAQFAGMRVLAWDGDVLYASRGYALLRAKMKGDQVRWELVARYRPEWWRSFTSHSRLGARLCRDGFHALAVMPSGHIIAALPGAIATLQPGETEFRVTHRVLRGTRPLHLAQSAARFMFMRRMIAARPGMWPTHSARARFGTFTISLRTLGKTACG